MYKPLISESRVYKDVNKDQPESFWDYENDDVEYGSRKKYQIVVDLGRGAFGIAFRGYDISNQSKVAIKVLRENGTSDKRFKREVKMLVMLKGGPNIVALLDIVRETEPNRKSFIFEYVDNSDIEDLYAVLKLEDVRFYSYEILKALDFCHSKGIMHRDIKPHNVMIDHKLRKVRLIDWGIADFYIAGKAYSTHVATDGYKSPELLMGYDYYDYGVDLWGFGVMLGGMVFRNRKFFFKPKDKFYRDYDNKPLQLDRITEVLGCQSYHEYRKFLYPNMDIGYMGCSHNKPIPKKPWTEFVTDENKDLGSEEVCDLIDKILVFNHAERLTAQEAMNHPFFKSLHKEANETQSFSADIAQDTESTMQVENEQDSSKTCDSLHEKTECKNINVENTVDNSGVKEHADMLTKTHDIKEVLDNNSHLTAASVLHKGEVEKNDCNNVEEEIMDVG